MRLLNAVFLNLLLVGGACWGQGNTPAPVADRATAYYHYSLGHMYAELAGASTNRNDYVNSALENYKAAIKADPNSPLLAEELSDLYSQSGRMRDGQNDSEQAIKLNPNDLAAHRVLARIYVRQIDAQRGRVNEQMLKQATQEYQKITELAPKDANAWVWLGRLQSASQNTDAAEKAFRKALDLEPDNEDGLTGLATAMDVDADVERLVVGRQHQRLAHDHDRRLPAEVLLDGAAVDEDLAAALLHEDARHRRLATAGAVVPVSDHRAS